MATRQVAATAAVAVEQSEANNKNVAGLIVIAAYRRAQGFSDRPMPHT
jgi:hypothetical protein